MYQVNCFQIASMSAVLSSVRWYLFYMVLHKPVTAPFEPDVEKCREVDEG